MTAFKDYFSAHAKTYSEFRPTYPPDLFAFVASAAPARELVWDCGTGNGQAAVGLAAHFAKVFATDASADQVANADPRPNVEYAAAPAERCPLPDAAADAVTVAQALHWFDFDRFYAEVRRVCRPGGLLAAWGYGFHRVNPDVDRVLARFEGEFVGPHWPPERRHIDARLQSIPFPFSELPVPEFAMSVRWTLPELLGYLGTWSATKRFQAAHRFDPVGRLAPEFAAAWGDPDEARAVTWDLFLRAGRVG